MLTMFGKKKSALITAGGSLDSGSIQDSREPSSSASSGSIIEGSGPKNADKGVLRSINDAKQRVFERLRFGKYKYDSIPDISDQVNHEEQVQIITGRSRITGKCSSISVRTAKGVEHDLPKILTALADAIVNWSVEEYVGSKPNKFNSISDRIQKHTDNIQKQFDKLSMVISEYSILRENGCFQFQKTEIQELDTEIRTFLTSCNSYKNIILQELERKGLMSYAPKVNESIDPIVELIRTVPGFSQPKHRTEKLL